MKTTKKQADTSANSTTPTNVEIKVTDENNIPVEGAVITIGAKPYDPVIIDDPINLKGGGYLTGSNGECTIPLFLNQRFTVRKTGYTSAAGKYTGATYIELTMREIVIGIPDCPNGYYWNGSSCVEEIIHDLPTPPSTPTNVDIKVTDENNIPVEGAVITIGAKPYDPVIIDDPINNLKGGGYLTGSNGKCTIPLYLNQRFTVRKTGYTSAAGKYTGATYIELTMREIVIGIPDCPDGYYWNGSSCVEEIIHDLPTPPSTPTNVDIKVTDENNIPVEGAVITIGAKPYDPVIIDDPINNLKGGGYLTGSNGKCTIPLYLNQRFTVRKTGYTSAAGKYTGATYIELTMREIVIGIPDCPDGYYWNGSSCVEEYSIEPPVIAEVYGTVTDKTGNPIASANVYETDSEGNVDTRYGAGDSQIPTHHETNSRGEYQANREATHILVEKQGYVNQLKKVPQSTGHYQRNIELNFMLELENNNGGGDEPTIPNPTEPNEAGIFSNISNTWKIALVALGLGILIKSKK